MARKQLQWIFTSSIILIVVAAILAVPRIFLPKIREMRALSAKRERLGQLVQSREEEIADLKRRQLRFREDPEFVERIARQNRLVRPGEIIFIFESPEE